VLYRLNEMGCWMPSGGVFARFSRLGVSRLQEEKVTDRLKPGDRVRFREAPFSEGTVHRVGWDGAYSQQLMVEVKWNTGGFGGPFVRDLERIEEVPTPGPTP
jgi:hypothetical protein